MTVTGGDESAAATLAGELVADDDKPLVVDDVVRAAGPMTVTAPLLILRAGLCRTAFLSRHA